MSPKAEKVTRQKGAQQKVLDALKERRHEEITLNELVKATGLNRSQVAGAVQGLRAKLNGQLENVGEGIYAYHPKQVSSGLPLYERLAVAKNGDWVMQDESGDVFILSPKS
jgi:DNA-binding IclR family transcriptional regulator